MSTSLRFRASGRGTSGSASNHHHSPDNNSGRKAVQIVKTCDDHTFALDEQALESILLSNEVCDKKVVVVSVAGALRKGKSFLLNYFLRFLVKGGLNGQDDWMGQEDEPLYGGFSWRHGSRRETTGILMWSKPFIARLPGSEEEVAILLLDTEGTFDHHSTVEENTTIFALSTMVSSVQIYNLTSQIQENDLQHLNLFTEYGKLAMEGKSSTTKPFQSLCFLVRDWGSQKDHPLGLQGGESYLREKFQLKNTEDAYNELGDTRHQIMSYFEKVFCFLMPHPGFRVSEDSEEERSDGRLSDIRDKFRDQLKVLVPLILSPENLVIKKINGTPLTGQSLFGYFKIYMETFNARRLPTPRTILDATASVVNPPLINVALQKYENEIQKVVRFKPFVYEDNLEKQHKRIMEECVDDLKSSCMGTRRIKEANEQELCIKIDAVYQGIKSSNNIRRRVTQVAATTVAATTSVVIVGALVYAAGGVGVAALTGLATVVLRYIR